MDPRPLRVILAVLQLFICIRSSHSFFASQLSSLAPISAPTGLSCSFAFRQHRNGGEERTEREAFEHFSAIPHAASKSPLPLSSLCLLPLFLSQPLLALAAATDSPNAPVGQRSIAIRPAARPFAYSVELTDPPTLQPRSRQGEESLLQRLADADILLLGFFLSIRRFVFLLLFISFPFHLFSFISCLHFFFHIFLSTLPFHSPFNPPFFIPIPLPFPP